MAASEDGSQRNAAATKTADDTSSVGPSVSYDVSLKYSFNQRSAVWQHVYDVAAPQLWGVWAPDTKLTSLGASSLRAFPHSCKTGHSQRPFFGVSSGGTT